MDARVNDDAVARAEGDPGQKNAPEGDAVESSAGESSGEDDSGSDTSSDGSGGSSSATSSSAGDDGDEGSNEEEDSSEEEEEEDEEPLLKYRRLKSSVTEILSGGKSSAPDTAACLAFHPSFMVLGTQSGALYILDRAGAERNKIVLHHGRVHDVSIEPSGQRIASCAEDGTVAIIPVLGSEAPLTHAYGSPVLSVQLDPGYSTKRDRVFVCGGDDSKIRVNRRGWFTSNETILDRGEGPVSVVRWHGHLVAWANNRGVKIYDLERGKPVTRVDRPQLKHVSSELAHNCRCKLVWENNRILLIGWGDCWMIVNILPVANQGGEKGTALSGRITSVHYVRSLICGIAPYGEDICLLTCSEGRSASESEGDDSDSDGDGGVCRPELRILERETGDQRCCDMLPVFGYEMCNAFDYSLESDRGNQTEEPQDQSTVEEEAELPILPSLYIISPKDIVVATPRTVDDHIKWALEHGQYEKALEIAEHAEPPLPPAQYQMLATRYLGHLVKEKQFRTAASLCTRLLRKDRDMWQQSVLLFAKAGELREIGPYVPGVDVQLEQSTYEMILAAFLDEGDDVGFRDLISKWSTPDRRAGSAPGKGDGEPGTNGDDPNTQAPLYNMIIVIAKVRAVLDRRGSMVLRETLSYLYMISGEEELAIALYLDYPRQDLKGIASTPLPIDIFGYIEERNLFHKLVLSTQPSQQQQQQPPRVANLMKIDEKRALTLLMKAPVDVLSIHAVAKQLEMYDSCLLLKYLHHLFERRKKIYNTVDYKPWHGLQVSLYAQAASIVSHSTEPASGGGAQVETIVLRGWISNNDVIQYTFNDKAYQCKVEGAVGLDGATTFLAAEIDRHEGVGAVKGDSIGTVNVVAVPTKSSKTAQPFTLGALSVTCAALLPFLKNSNLYSMEKAYKDCEQREKPLYKEMVYILRRLGNTQKALSLIIDKIGDVKQAIEFIEESHDDALWEQLISKSLTNTKYVSGLLQDVGSTIANPSKLIRQIPDKMKVPGLRDHLAKFVSDYRLLLELQRGCNEVLKEDCINLLQRLRWVQRSGVRISRNAACKMTGVSFHSSLNRTSEHYMGGDQAWEVDMESGEVNMMVQNAVHDDGV